MLLNALEASRKCDFFLRTTHYTFTKFGRKYFRKQASGLYLISMLKNIEIASVYVSSVTGLMQGKPDRENLVPVFSANKQN